MVLPLEDTARQLINQLTEILARNEDAESAIAVYKTANWIISELESTKETGLNLAEQDMQERELSHLRTPAGSAGWTEPRARQLNEQVWLEAMARDTRLMRIQRDYDAARAALEQVQEPYMDTPEPRFFIR
ncbi:MAG TPA: hypothetical protein VIK64_04900 [Anaerolineales bacterium]|jgi:hypothetical protein